MSRFTKYKFSTNLLKNSPAKKDHNLPKTIDPEINTTKISPQFLPFSWRWSNKIFRVQEEPTIFATAENTIEGQCFHTQKKTPGLMQFPTNFCYRGG